MHQFTRSSDVLDYVCLQDDRALQDVQRMKKILNLDAIRSDIHASKPIDPPRHLTQLVACSILLLPWQALLPPCLDIPLSKPVARLDQLHHIQNLLRRHHRGRDGRKYPRQGRVHLVRSGQLHGPCAAGRCKESGSWMRRTARLRRRAGRFVVGKEGGSQGGRGEREEVESYEEEFIEGASCEKHILSVHENQHVKSKSGRKLCS